MEIVDPAAAERILKTNEHLRREHDATLALKLGGGSPAEPVNERADDDVHPGTGMNADHG